MSTQDQDQPIASSDATEPSAAAPPEEIPRQIVAGPGKSYRIRRYLIALVLFGFGIASIYDGFSRYPRENAKVHWPDKPPHTNLDITLNQGLGILLPPWGIFVLVMALYKSRGQYVLQDGVLYVPGHPPVPLDKIQSVGAETWDRKGIAEINYDLAGSPQAAGIPSNKQHGQIILDDFVYDQPPTDQIYKVIEQALVKTLKQAPAYTPPTVRTPPTMRMPPRPRMS